MKLTIILANLITVSSSFAAVIESKSCDLSFSKANLFSGISRAEKLELKKVASKRGYNLTDSDSAMSEDGINLDLSELNSEFSAETKSYVGKCSNGHWWVYCPKIDTFEDRTKLDIEGKIIIQRLEEAGLLVDVDTIEMNLKGVTKNGASIQSAIIKKLPKCKKID